jgi:hypothetical protein
MTDAVDPWPLFFHGGAGSGKTCAGLCLADWAGDSIYVTLGDLCRAVIDAQHGRNLFVEHISRIPPTNEQKMRDLCYPEGRMPEYYLSEGEVWKHWIRANVTVLDEIGCRSKPSDHEYQTLYKAIDLRVGAGLPMVAISNYSLVDIASIYDDRIASRLSAGTVVQCDGDRRLQGSSTATGSR